MTNPAAPPRLRRRHVHDANQAGSPKARLLLALACIWPLIVLFFFSSSTPSSNDGAAPPQQAGLESIRNLLDRVDILGYGPTHPRVAVVVVGDDRAKILSSVESVFRNTDLNRLFVVCAVMDGVESDPELVSDLRAIDQGAVPHWHGLRPDVHAAGETTGGDDEPHGKKVHVLFSKKRMGLAASRGDAVDFISLLEKKHEAAGLKSPQEDLIVLLLQPGAQLVSHSWLSAVTSALIVPPPLIESVGEEDATVAMKLANAVSFAVEGAATSLKATSFDYSFKPLLKDPSAKDMALSNGMSFPTPALAGAATAMRLDTYLNLPSQDESLTNDWPVHLDLSLNLWLCADGIDVLTDVSVEAPAEEDPAQPLTPKEAARFAAAWMDDNSSAAAYEAVTHTHKEITRLEWDTMMSDARASQNFAVGLQSKCRPFSWYAREINTDLVMPVHKKIEVATETPKEDAPKEKVPEVKKGESSEKQLDQEKVEVEKVVVPKKPLPIPDVDEDNAPPPRNDPLLPSKPLDQARLDIISTAKPVDLKYVNVTGGFKEFPHEGAKDADGKWGYEHDETALRKNPPPFEFADLNEACAKRDNHYRMLHEKVFVDLEAHETKEKSGVKRDKIFCLVYTISPGHKDIPNIRETWGPKCDGFMVGSNLTDVSIGAVNIPHEGPEEYNNIWQKVRSMWSYVYDNYYDSYDWFHIGGDDLYLLVENLRLYLESEEIKLAANGGIYLPTGNETSQTPLFLGRRFAYQGDMNDIFISGGSGYTMNKAALKALVVNGFPNYFPHAHTFSEDTMVARVFRKMGVFPYDTKDETGAERYMPFLPGHHLTYRLPKDPSKDWYARYSIDIKFGLDHCADRSVAFHYVKGDMMKRMHALLYHMCPEEEK